MKGTSCRCYAHANCSLAHPRAGFTNDQYIDWLLRGVLADVFSKDGHLSWQDLTKKQKDARTRRHKKIAEDVP